MRANRRELGRKGEDIAVAFLERRGYRIIRRNYRCPYGEMDIVARDGDVLAFVEVKTRRSRRYGMPEESITPAKQARLIEVAQAYVQESGWQGDWRIDVVAIELSATGKLRRLELLENAICSP